MKNEIPHFTNFQPLVDLCSSTDRSNSLSKWISGNPNNATNLSHDVIAQFTESIGKWALNGLRNQIKTSSSRFFTIMADESTDIATRTELSVCVRFLDQSGSPKESFITIKELNVANASL